MRRVLIAIGIALLLVVVTAPAAYARPNEWYTICHHTVRPGETIYCIARAYGVSPWAIASHNGIANPNLIHPGQMLAIPNAYAWVTPGPTCANQCYPPYPGPGPCWPCTYHTVAPGQTLYGISLWYGVNMWHIARCNHIYNLNYIRAGDVLCIP